ncbi:MAG TPA: bifunctional proline dehydrogenase/L-glutamate gamma-semialdehyde dehydrogenase PutA [Xanthobacteraceae bacterium]|jgi:RHH-type proline utilization regulon transcriptional repressor/proline dehydrogenase/delta 1-pyrroline-5-carboxylate dehydrogenase|nr:bifunctional proline dehydrogenase/L-glutamate gamma-semialdehyde dehydrogenase PutA [Xanthobacteraceae bacterium]
MTADTLRRLPQEASAVPAFAARYAPSDEEIAAELLPQASLGPAIEARIDARGARLAEAVRARAGGLGGIEDFLHEYSLSTREGLALMVLAEALLRVPDAVTADRLIEDKLAGGDWSHHEMKSHALLVSASAWALGISARIIHPGDTPDGILDNLAKRIGLPALRAAVRQAMRLLGSHFVLGQTIEDALARAAARPGFRYSFDMLGEGARTAADAERYFEAYAHAIAAIGAGASGALPDRPGISVKLSALHPRYEPLARERVMAELAPRLIALARQAKAHDLNFTVDAEEADRLELSLELIGAGLADPGLRGWDGFGLAIQAYQKRAPQVVDWITAAAQALGARVMVRLVKGAYWDTEVKRAQERGLADYPVFTRKAMTDLNYMACARKLLSARPRIFPQFATHNALTVASVIAEAGGVAGYEFQRLHGMGEALYHALMADEPGAACRVYAPVGDHRDLLAYLVRRLLENGANSSFVSVAADPAVPIAEILRRPQAAIADPRRARHPRIVRPPDLYAPTRRNSTGIEFGDRAALAGLVAEIRKGTPASAQATPLVDGVPVEGRRRAALSPIDGSVIGEVSESDEAAITAAMAAAARGFPAWAATSLALRAAALERAGDLIESRRGALVALLAREGGKTLADSVAEVREAVDLCRYYAAQARSALAPEPMPGPTGETNELHYRGRGVFACISPWNFPLAIFVGQVAAALAAGNAVVAKPAEQTPLIAAEAVRLLHAAGVPMRALHLLPGDGEVGARIVADPRLAGVAFTGSTEVARKIASALAAKNGPIVPFIAETGGINAMIVDATALPEQVTDDVMASAFRSAGQRCSSLRLLCVQDDVADEMLGMIAGAAAELTLGDPREPATDVGPVIDADAKARLDRWIADHAARVRFRWDRDRPLPQAGTYVAPAIVDLDDPAQLTEEVFGPILHVVRWPANAFDRLLDAIAGSGFGLTLGVHSRIDATVARAVARLATGNVYVNRNMIGAVVGTQPFGGSGLSGTGPKAGGPNYLRRFATEQTVTINSAAIGGNASLLTADD